MKSLNYLLVSFILFIFIACGSENDTSEASTVEETIIEETIIEETYEDEEVDGDWEPPGGRMDKYMDLKAEGYSHEEAVKIMKQDME